MDRFLIVIVVGGLMRRSALTVLLFSSLLLCFACTPNEARPLVPLEAGDGATGFVLGLKIGNAKKSTSCSIDVVDDEHEVVATLTSTGTMRSLRHLLSSGDYGFDNLRCGSRRIKELERKAIAFKVVSGHISWLGDLDFRPIDNDTGAWTLRYGDEKENEDGDDTPGDWPSSLKRLSGLTKAQRQALISGYSERPVPTKGPKRSRRLPETRVKPIVSMTVGTLPARPIDLDPCFDKELAKNPLIYGSWKLQVDYRKKTMKRMEVEQDNHLYSPSLVACVKEILSKHRTGTPDIVTYELNL